MSANTLDSLSITRLKQLDTADTDTQNTPHHHHQHHQQQQQQQQQPHSHQLQQQQSAALARLLQAVHLIAVIFHLT